ncbi:MAG: hypothetical protein R2706_00035 [Acidimicrobiales bacterium]
MTKAPSANDILQGSPASRRAIIESKAATPRTRSERVESEDELGALGPGNLLEDSPSTRFGIIETELRRNIAGPPHKTSATACRRLRHRPGR